MTGPLPAFGQSKAHKVQVGVGQVLNCKTGNTRYNVNSQRNSKGNKSSVDNSQREIRTYFILNMPLKSNTCCLPVKIDFKHNYKHKDLIPVYEYEKHLGFIHVEKKQIHGSDPIIRMKLFCIPQYW